MIDAADPLLTDDKLARIADDRRPDRLAWNTFRTLALWETDRWVPALLDVAFGDGNALSALDWSGASVVPWGAGPDTPDVCDVVLDGAEAYVVVACSLVAGPPVEQAGAAAVAALDGSLHGGREAGLVLALPPDGEDAAADRLLKRATAVELMDGSLAADLLAATGTVTWAYLARLALDLAEEPDPDTGPVEQVHQLVTEIQVLYPGVEV
ncbi:MAG: hypothetical protein ACRD2W_08825 [Acidimicrobiales bacterium]